jgi:hypothetical protein
MQSLWMGVRPGPDRTLVLVQDGLVSILKARLPEAPRHPRALETLAKAVALWYGRPLYAALGVPPPAVLITILALITLFRKPRYRAIACQMEREFYSDWPFASRQSPALRATAPLAAGCSRAAGKQATRRTTGPAKTVVESTPRYRGLLILERSDSATVLPHCTVTTPSSQPDHF